jgi:hypothetical protein
MSNVIFALLSMVLFVVMSGLLFYFRDKNFVRRETIRANNARAISRHLQWINDHPYCDNSHPEAQLLLKKRINAYGLFAKEFHPIDGDERLKELICQLELAEV